MRVVCAACNEHYADIDDSVEFAEMLVYSDALALWHGQHCTATPEQHRDGVAWIEVLDNITCQ